MPNVQKSWKETYPLDEKAINEVAARLYALEFPMEGKTATSAGDVSLDQNDVIEAETPDMKLIAEWRATKKLDFAAIARSICDRAFEVDTDLREVTICRVQMYGRAEVILGLDSYVGKDNYGNPVDVYLDSYRSKAPRDFPIEDLELVAEDALKQMENSLPPESEQDRINFTRPKTHQS